MNFSKFAKLIYSYIGAGRDYPNYVLFLTGLIMSDPSNEKEMADAAEDKDNPLSSLSGSSLSKIYNGDRVIGIKNASVIHGRFDKTKFVDAIYALTDDLKEKLQRALSEYGIASRPDNVDEVCADIFGQLINNLSNGNAEITIETGTKRDSTGNRITEVPLAMAYFESGKLHVGGETITLPIQLVPSSAIASHEQPYINALCNAYADALSKDSITKDDIDTLPRKYQENFRDQRKYYYGAESIQRSVREVYEDGENQFNILKDDAYEGIKETHLDSFPNGYERLRAVLKKITSTTLDKSTLTRIKNLIGNLEKKGICHILVNDNKIESWVDSDD